MNNFQIRKSNFKLIVANGGVDEIRLLEFFDSAEVHTYKNFAIVETIGTSGSGDDEFSSVGGVAVSPDLTKVAVCDTGNTRIVVRSLDDLEYLLETPASSEYLGVAWSPDGNYLFVAQNSVGDSHILKLNASTLAISSTSTFYTTMFSITISPDGTHLFTTAGDIVRKHLASDFSVVTSIGTTGSGDDQFSGPLGICIDPDNEYIYISDSGNDRIVKRLASDLSYVDESSVSLDNPVGICISPDGRYLFVSDNSNDRIVVLNSLDLSLVSEYAVNITAPYGLAITGFGENRVQTIAEPATNYFYDKLIKYLPAFVVENEILEAILKGFQSVLLEAKKYINASTGYSLTNYRYQGVGLKQSARELFLFLSGEEAERETQWIVENHETIHQQRGSMLGLRNDLYRATRDKYLTIEEVPADECGWWLDETFPQISPAGAVEKSATASFLDCENQINVNVADNSGAYTEEQLNDIISKYLIPAHTVCNVVYKYIPSWRVPIDTTYEIDLIVETR